MSTLIDDFHTYEINCVAFQRLYNLFDKYIYLIHDFFKNWMNDSTLNLVVDCAKLRKGDYLARLSLLSLFKNTPYDQEDMLVTTTQVYREEQ